MFGSQPERLFSSGDLSEFLAQRRGEMLAAIEAVPAESLLNTPVYDLVEQLVAKHQCEPLALRPEETSTDEEEVSLSIDEVPDGRFMFPDGDESELVVPGSLITFHVPFTGEAELFHLRGSTWSTSMPRGEVRSAELVFAYKSNAPNADQLKANYQRALNQTQEHVRDSSRLVVEFNTRLVSEARSAIDGRREKILRARSTVASLGFPMKRRPDAPKTYTVPVMRKKIKPQATGAPSGAPFKPEPTLDSNDYEEILRIVHSMTMVLERSPAAFRTLGEEDLRMHFLVQLNGQFEGAATGETFNADGKTDILIRVDDKNIFIAECKFWKGQAAFTATVDQLLGYLSWRDTKTAIFVFNRDVAMSTVVDQIPGLLRTHPNFKRELPATRETEFRAVLHQANDQNRDVVVTVFVFDVPR